MSFVINKKLLDMQKAINAFKDSVTSGEIILPDDLEPVLDTTEANWPTAIIYNQMVVPISYNAETNTISILVNQT